MMGKIINGNLKENVHINISMFVLLLKKKSYS